MTSLVMPSELDTALDLEKTPIFLWATPRSVSTALERVMKNSLELHVVHEPYTDSYFFGPDRRSNRYGDKVFRDMEIPCPNLIEAEIRNGEGSKRSFVKELAFQGAPYTSDRLLVDSDHLMITRHPKSVYASLINLKPDFTEDEFGFTALARIASRLTNLKRDVFILDGDAFRLSPSEIVQSVCTKINIPFDPEMLNWNDGRIRDWKNGEKKSQAVWHRALEQSNTVMPPTAIPDIEILPKHQAWYQRAIDIYYALTGTP